MKKKEIDYSLYLVTNTSVIKNKDLCRGVEKALEGGVTLVQLREKRLNHKSFLDLAIKVKSLTDKYSVPLIINDNIAIAKEINACGVHIGQDDESLTMARKILSNDKIIGVSVSNEKEAIKAINDGADYLGIGTVFFTSTKKDIKKPIGLAGLEKIAKNVTIPSVAIGGINQQNAMDVMSCGVNGVAVISAILASDDIKKSSSQLLEIIKEAKCKK